MESLAQVINGIDNAVTTVHADVISESFGSTSLPTSKSGQLLEFFLFNPRGAVVQQSYDDGTPGRAGSSPNIQHAEVADPAPGRWTAEFRWGGDDDYVEIAPAAPGAYRGPMSFRVSG